MTRKHLISHLEEAIAATKQEALSHLVRELITQLAQNGYKLEDFIEAIADYTDSNESWDKATKRLEEASEEIGRVRGRAN